MIAFIELTHIPAYTKMPDFVGSRLYATLIDKNQVNPDIPLKCSYATLTKTETNSLIRCVVKTGDAGLSALANIITDADLKIELYGLTGAGEIFLSRDEGLVSDYRIDSGPLSVSVSLTVREFHKDAIGATRDLSTVFKKSKSIVSGVTYFDFGIPPTEYRYIGISQTVTHNGDTFEVLSKNLVMTDQQATLTIRVKQL